MSAKIKHFDGFLASLEPKLRELLNCPPLDEARLRQCAGRPGIYLFSEGSCHLYVGRTDNLKKRIQTQRRSGAGTNQAAFAYAIAKHELSIPRVPYNKNHPAHPQMQPGFDRAFHRAKQRVRIMTVRVVQEDDSIGQALLEIYVHLRLHTEFNQFDNH